MEPPLMVVLVPFPAQGHITPILQLAAALRRGGFRPVLAVPDFVYSRLRLRASGGELELASVPTRGGDRPIGFEEIDVVMERDMAAGLEGLLVRWKEKVACVVVDLLVSPAIGAAERCGLAVAGFWPAMVATYRLVAAIPELVREGCISENGTPLNGFTSQFLQNHQNYTPHQPKHMLSIPKVKLSTNDLPWLIGNQKTQKSRFHFWVRVMTRAQSLHYILANSFPNEEPEPEPEPEPKKQTHNPHLLPIGPLLSTTRNNLPHHFPSMWDEDHSCLSWLDGQSPTSVIYASFGSWVRPFGPERTQEIALGLEATKRPFLWVLKEDEAWRLGLPKGYMERVSLIGKVVNWAPQKEVLKHQAVGCYLTHCGWNSTMEAIMYGKRLICYPIAGDQFVNCAYIEKVWGIGIKPDGFGREDIRDGIERVMDGKEGGEMEERVLELRERVMGEGGKLGRENLELFFSHIRK